MFLVAQSNYNCIQLGIFEDLVCLKQISIDKASATQMLIPELNNLLNNLKIRLSNLEFIGSSAGPAPFTTLRVLLSTLNGIALSTDIPLVEISSLEVLLKENLDKEYNFTLVLLNAFSNDAYYAFRTPDKVKIGCANIEDLIETIKYSVKDEKIKIIGNGVEYFNQYLKILNYYIPKDNPEYTTLEQVAKASLEKFESNKTTKKILPIYLKEAVKN